MKHFLLVVLLAVSGITFAQQMGLPSGHYVRSLEAGYTTFRPYALNDFLFGYGPQKSFSSLTTFGYCGSGVILSRGGMIDGALALNFYYPQEVIIKPDTLKYRVGGWELMTSLYAIDLLTRVEPIDLIVAPGIYWGSIRLRKYNSAGNFKANELFKNPFVAPMMRADLRVLLWKICIGARLSYRFDITSSKWRKGSSVTLPGYKFREGQYVVYIGWQFGNPKSRK